MSWDLIVFSFPDPKINAETGEAIVPDWGEEGPPDIGTGTQIREQLSQVYPNILWDGDHGEIETELGSIEFHINDSDSQISNFMLFCHGNPSKEIVHMASSTGWCILDMASNRWMHLTDDPEQGLRQHQEFVSHIMGFPEETSSGTLSKHSRLHKLLGWMRRK